VNAAFNAAGRNRAVYNMENVIIFEVAHVEDVGIAEFAQIVGLTSGRRVEMRLVEQDAPAAGVVASERVRQRLAADYIGGEIILKRIVVVEPASGHGNFIEASLAQEN
jgi:hypothetical protein